MQVYSVENLRCIYCAGLVIREPFGYSHYYSNSCDYYYVIAAHAVTIHGFLFINKIYGSYIDTSFMPHLYDRSGNLLWKHYVAPTV
jgi:hypothetical protein